MSHPAPLRGHRYLLAAVIASEYQYLAGRELTIDTLGEHLGSGYYSITGRIDGIPGSFDFPDGVKLSRIHRRNCSCLAYPFPHSRGKKCRMEAY